MSIEKTPPPQISERFCALDSDITLQSSDGVLFKVHRKNLEMHAEGFAGADAVVSASKSSDNEIIPLSETSTTLELLLQYMYRQPQPNLQQVDFGTLAAVAEAAEKYQVYAAVTICQFLMGIAIPQHPLEVLKYATIHDHRNLMDQAAGKTISMSVDDVVKSLLPNGALAWFRYREAFQRALHALFNDVNWLSFGHRIVVKDKDEDEDDEDYSPQIVFQACEEKPKVTAIILQRLGSSPAAFTTPEQTLNILVFCENCRNDIAHYIFRIRASLKNIPRYSTFL